ncbi:MAG: hypothetical protein C5B59_01995 [Bacteroidetes bacterium]|nr:MAG: hypothetical protein C5B59_01995 [Bacteroidota bacterium]
MYLIRLLLSLCFIPSIAWSQTPLTNKSVNDTTPNLPDHYVQKMAQFEKEPVATGKIMFVGNSITEGGNWGKLFGDSTIINRGISGDVTFGVLKRMDDITKRKPSKLFLIIGINDISKDIPDVVIADNIRKIIQEIQQKSPSTRIFLENILPVNPDVNNFPQHYDKNQHVIATNLLLKDLASKLNVTFIDTYSFFNDGSGKLRKEFTNEGLHINPAGYEAWAQFLKDNHYL